MTRIIFIVLLGVLLTQCNSFKIDKVFQKHTPYETYAASLEEAGLDETLLGKKWLSAGRESLCDSLFVELPYAETGYFAETVPTAKVYNFHLEEGSLFHAELKFMGDTVTTIFMDFFQRKASWEASHLGSTAEDSLLLEYEIGRSGSYTLRIQPELLGKGYFDLRLHTVPVYGFPVSGKDFKAIGSLFGTPRDGGKRRHEGVDIFAKKGTPVVAVANGRITRVQERGLGGKVVWQWDNRRNVSLYYAHLDSQLVVSGQQVSIGDTLGLVGNTGNARFTPPHLHFGVYRSGHGARDPYPFLHQPKIVHFDLAVLQPAVHKWHAIGSKKANVRISPSTQALIIFQAEKDTPVFITGASMDWYNVILPDQTKGYVHKSVLRDAGAISPDLVFETKTEVWENPAAGSSLMGYLEPKVPAPVLGKFLGYYLVTFNGMTGWVSLH